MQKFHVGQIIEHQLFGYRGVVIGADVCFEGNADLFIKLPIDLPNKQQPWYYILVDHQSFYTYVAEQNLQISILTQQVEHPLLGQFFDYYNGIEYTKNIYRD